MSNPTRRDAWLLLGELMDVAEKSGILSPEDDADEIERKLESLSDEGDGASEVRP